MAGKTFTLLHVERAFSRRTPWSLIAAGAYLLFFSAQRLRKTFAHNRTCAARPALMVAPCLQSNPSPRCTFARRKRFAGFYTGKAIRVRYHRFWCSRRGIPASATANIAVGLAVAPAPPAAATNAGVTFRVVGEEIQFGDVVLKADGLLVDLYPLSTSGGY